MPICNLNNSDEQIKDSNAYKIASLFVRGLYYNVKQHTQMNLKCTQDLQQKELWNKLRKIFIYQNKFPDMIDHIVYNILNRFKCHLCFNPTPCNVSISGIPHITKFKKINELTQLYDDSDKYLHISGFDFLKLNKYIDFDNCKIEDVSLQKLLDTVLIRYYYGN